MAIEPHLWVATAINILSLFATTHIGSESHRPTLDEFVMATL